MKLKDLLSEDIFRNYMEMIPYNFKKFMDKYKSIDTNNRVVSKKTPEGDVFYGSKKGSKTAEWKYIEDEYRLYSDMSDQEVWQIIRR